MAKQPGNDTSNTYQGGIIQLSTLERSYRTRPAYRYVAHSTSIASVVSRLQLAATQGFVAFLVILMTLFYPAGAYANETPATEQATETTTSETQSTATETEPTKTTESTQQSQETQPAPTTETKPATTTQTKTTTQQEPAKTTTTEPKEETKPKYTWNEAMGCWENGTYCWNPDTGQTKPLDSPDYSYNKDTEHWDTKDWRYDPVQEKYVPNTVHMAPAEDDSVKMDSGSEQFFDLYHNAEISNNIYSSAQTGDAWVSGNTLGGSALTGDALTIATIFNMINSTAGFASGSEIATFSSDIYGDVYGDLYVDPSVLATVQPASGINANNVDVNVDANLSNKIENNIALNAQSGDATVTKNTDAGSATSGSADAVANIINMLNTAISSGGSFIGMLNIHGSLNGDILLPIGLLNTLLASNSTAPGSSQTAGSSQTTDVDVNLNDKQSITNNILADAQSGDATIAHNTEAGTATTGNSETNLTILNLTGRDVVAANSMLVFVNVLGHWVGVIMDAPAGSTSAALGTNVTKNDSQYNADYDVNTEGEIVNNVRVNAQSGDASVTNNTKAGDATTGDATASVNVANIMNSSFSLAEWFGIFVINVYGEWLGSFGVDTAYGNKPARNNKPSSTDKKSPTAANNTPKVFRFVPNGQGGNTLASVDTTSQVSEAAVQQAEEAARNKILAESKQTDHADNEDTVQNQQKEESSDTTDQADLALPIIGFAIGGSLLGGERLVSRRQRRKLG